MPKYEEIFDEASDLLNNAIEQNPAFGRPVKDIITPVLLNMGIKGEIENTFINIKMTKKENNFHFYIENNISEGPSIVDKEYSGLGLKNIQENLTLVYPNNHSFEIEKTSDTFVVSLKITLNDH